MFFAAVHTLEGCEQQPRKADRGQEKIRLKAEKRARKKLIETGKNLLTNNNSVDILVYAL